MSLSANDLDKKVMDYVHKYEVTPVLQHMKLVGAGQIAEVKDESDRGCNRYYQWLACLMRVIKPKQVVELGAAAGISTIMMATELPKDSLLFSVDIDPDLAWKWMDRDYPQVVKILGDDLDMGIWTKDLYPPVRGVNLEETDVWFFDSLHTEEQLRAELKLYTPFFKKGAILVFDDIKVPGLDKVWEELPYDKQDITIPCHYSGFGVAIV